MKYYWVIFIILIGIAFISCSTAGSSIPDKGTLEGRIFSIGPEPFTKLGLQTENGEIFILKSTKEIESELSTKQGKILKIEYNGTEQTPDGQIIKVVRVE
jgi:hypothetical protein